MVLCAVAQEHQPVPVVVVLLGDLEAQAVTVERDGRVQVVYEQVHRPDLGDGEGPRQHDAFDIVLCLQSVHMVVPGIDVDALGQGLTHLVLFRHLGQRRLFTETPVVHVTGLTTASPADLLNAVIKLVDVAVRVHGVDVPVAARHVTPDTLDAYAVVLEVVGPVDHFFQGPGLPRNLVDGHLTATATASRAP